MYSIGVDKILQQFTQGFDSVFRDIETAENLIKKYSSKYPDHADEIDSAFLKLRRTDVLQGKDHLYKKHVEELLLRVIEGRNLAPATRAEVLGCMSEVTKIGPIRDRDFLNALSKLLDELFEDEQAKTIAGEIKDMTGPESHIGGSDEVVDVIGRKLKFDFRAS